MAVRLFFAPRIDALHDAFCVNVAAANGASAGLLPDPIHVVVPSTTMASGLKLALADRQGIAFDLRHSFLESFVGALGATPEPGGTDRWRALDAGRLRHLMLARFEDAAFMARPELTLLQHYLECGDGARARTLRRVGLAGHIARLFEEYGFQCPALVDAWRKGELFHSGRDMHATEVWQRALFFELLDEGALKEKGWVWLPDLPRQIRAGLELPGLPSRLQVFGFAHMAPGFLDILGALGERTDVTIYTLAPDHDAAAEDDSSPLAHGWGRALRDYEAQLLLLDAESSAGSRDESSRDGCAPSALLGAVADSIRIVSALDMRAEAEAVATAIWERLAAPADDGEPLRFHEIAVLVDPRQLDLYRPHLHAAFRDHGDLPLSDCEHGAVADSRAADLVLALLALPASRCTRADLLRVLTHPLVLHGHPSADRDEWLELAAELGIYHGAGAEDLVGTYAESAPGAPGLHTWDQGLARLVLGSFLGDFGGEPVKIGAGEALPARLSPGEIPGAALFLRLARLLLCNARAARQARLSAGAWGLCFEAMLEDLRLELQADDKSALARCGTKLRDLAELEEIEDGEPRLLDHHEAVELAREVIEKAAASGLGLRQRGVILRSLSAPPPLPARVTFVLGLGEGLFPVRDASDGLDLGRDSESGDLPGALERGMFLLNLLSTREELVLSYVGRNALTGDRLAPSSVVQELRELLPRDPDEDLTTGCLPLMSGSLPATRFASVRHRRQQQARMLGDSLRQSVAEPVSAARLVDAVDRPIKERLASMLVLDDLGGVGAPADSAPRSRQLDLPIAVLRGYLESPLQGWARLALGLGREEGGERTEIEDEPFCTGRLEEVILLRRVFLERLLTDRSARPDDLVALQQELGLLTHREELAGRLPTGSLLDAERRRWMRTMERWGEALATMNLSLHELRLGRADRDAPSHRIEDPVVVTVTDADGVAIEVRLHGRTGAVDLERGTMLVLSDRPSEKLAARHAVRAYLDSLVLGAAGLLAGELELLVVSTDPNPDKRLDVSKLPAVSRDVAQDQLGVIVRDLLFSDNEVLLPVEAVWEWAKDSQAGDLVQQIDDLRADDLAKTATGRGPIHGLERFSAPPDAGEIACRRLGPILDLLGQDLIADAPSPVKEADGA